MADRCPSCKSFLTRLAVGDTVCGNARCPKSWQAAKRDFETSLLGAACRQIIGVPALPPTRGPSDG